MFNLRNLVSIRTKIMTLIMVSVILVVGSLLGVGILIFVRDKESYITEYNLSQVRAVGSSIESQLRQLVVMNQLLALRLQHSDASAAEALFRESTRSLKLRRLFISETNPSLKFHLKAAYGKGENTLSDYLDRLGWTSARLSIGQMVVGRLSAEELAVGTALVSRKGEKWIILNIITPEFHLTENEGSTRIYLVDFTGNPIFPQHSKPDLAIRPFLSEFLDMLADDPSTLGVRRAVLRKKKFWLAFQRLEVNDLFVVGLLPESLVFSAVGNFFQRSLILSLGILLVTAGFGLLLTKRILDKLRSMIAITDKMLQSDFSFRLETGGEEKGSDEISTLAASFNLVAEKFDSMIQEASSTVSKKYEQEALTWVQKNFLPSYSLELKNIKISAKALHSEKCGGSWWFHDHYGDFAVAIIMKSETVGVPAAILTAVIYSAASTFFTSARTLSSQVDLEDFVIHLNAAVYHAFRGSLKASACAIRIDTLTGEVKIINAGYPVPFLQRLKFDSLSSDLNERFESLKFKNHALLGSGITFKVDPEVFHLTPGDLLFWYPAEVFKRVNSEGEDMSKSKLLSIFAEIYDRSSGQANKIVENLIGYLDGFYGDMSKDLRNDLAFMVVTISRKAKFEIRDLF